MSTLTLLREEGFQVGLLEGIEVGIEKGKQEGIEEGKYKHNIIAIRNMTLKKLQPSVIAEFLSLSVKYVQQLQKALNKEAEIIASLSKKQSPARIAKRLKVSEWLVEVIQELQKKKA